MDDLAGGIQGILRAFVMLGSSEVLLKPADFSSLGWPH